MQCYACNIVLYLVENHSKMFSVENNQFSGVIICVHYEARMVSMVGGPDL